MSTPSPAPLLPRRRRWSWRRRLLVSGVALGVTVGGAVTAAAAERPAPGARYVTGRVELGSVAQTTDFLGTVGAASPTSVGFPLGGEVTSVSVAPGQRVTAGQVLATIDPAALQTSLAQAKASLASAQANLTAVDAAAATPAPSATGTGTGGAGSGAAAASVQAAHQACAPVLSGVAPVAASGHGRGGTTGAAVRVAAASATAAPGTATGTPSGTPTQSPTDSPTESAAGTPTTEPTGTPTGTPTATPTGTPTGTPSSTSPAGPAPAAVAACLQALSTSLQAEQHAASSTNHPTATGAGAGPGGGARNSTTPDQAQAAVTEAEAQVTVDEHALAGATLTSPVAGEVASVPFTVGATENSSESVLVVDPGAVSVTVQVPLTQLAGLSVGGTAQVVPSGSSTALPGRVTSIAVLPTTATEATGANATAGSSSPTDAVAVVVTSPPPSLAIGSSAGVTVTTGHADRVLTVPDSALTPLGENRADVTVLGSGGSTRVVQVATGTVGDGRTQVTSGVSAGEQVVLADSSQPLPDAVPTTGGRGFGNATGTGSGRRGGSSGL